MAVKTQLPVRHSHHCCDSQGVRRPTKQGKLKKINGFWEKYSSEIILWVLVRLAKARKCNKGLGNSRAPPHSNFAKSLQSGQTLFDPADWSPLGSSIHGILQARMGCHALVQGIFLTQESKPDRTLVSPPLAGEFFTTSAIMAMNILSKFSNKLYCYCNFFFFTPTDRHTLKWKYQLKKNPVLDRLSSRIILQ